MNEDGERAGCAEAWFHNHIDAARRSLARRIQAPVQTLLMVSVLGFILALPAYAWLLLDHARALVATVGDEPRIALYLDDTDEEELARLAAEVSRVAGVGRVTATSADTALAAYRSGLADPSLLDWMEGNPLPAILDVAPLLQTTEALEELEQRLHWLLPQAILVSDHEFVRRLQGLHSAGTRVLLVLAALLTLGVTLILAVATAADLRERREEIGISRCIGATDRFLRRPSLYGGLWIGLGGGLCGYLLLSAGVAWTREPVEAAAAVLDLPLRLAHPDLRVGIALLAAGVALGWIGARAGSAAALRDD